MRRPLVLSALAVVGLAATSTAAASSPPDGGWSFTDDLGVTIELDEAPTRVVALTDVAYSLMNYGVEPVGVFGYSGFADDVRFDGFDTSEITELGAIYGEINLEALAALDPDLVVTHAYPVDADGTFDPEEPLYGFADLDQQAEVEAIAPVAAIAMAGSAADVIERTTEFSLALGADDELVAEARTEFDAAAEALTAAADPDVDVLALYAESDGVWAAKAPDDPGLRFYSELGVSFADPVGDGYYWEVLSWETLPDVAFDVVLYSLRGLDAEGLNAVPTFAATPAAEAGQVHPWVFAGMDYVSTGEYLVQLADWLAAADDVR